MRRGFPLKRAFNEGFTPNGGFTLIEVVVALALISIILSALYGTFFLSNRAMEAADDTLLGLRELRNSFDLMGREAESSVFDRQKSQTRFEIEDRDIYGKPASRLTMTAFSPQMQGLSLISYRVEEKDDKLSLIKEITPTTGGDTAEAEMMEDIEGFRVEAKAAAKGSDGWVGTWDTAETGKLPEEIRITITVKMKERKVSLRQVVSPRIGKKI